MESFVYNDDVFCEGIDDLLEYLLLDYNEDLSDMEDDWQAKVEITRLEPMITFNSDWILERVDDDRIDEDGSCLDNFAKVLKQYEQILRKLMKRFLSCITGLTNTQSSQRKI